MKKGNRHTAAARLQMSYAAKLKWKQEAFREKMRERMRRWHIENARRPKRTPPPRFVKITFP